MKKEDKSINNTGFEDVLKEKLQNFSVPVDETSWGEIEKKLKVRSRRRVLTPWIITVASVAASIAILWLIFPFNSQISINNENTYFSENESHNEKNVLEEENDLIPFNAVQESPSLAIVPKEQSTRSKPDKRGIGTSDGDAVIITQEQKAEPVQVIPESEPDYLANQPEEKKKEDAHQTLVAFDPFSDDWDLSPKSKKRTKSSLGLLASVGSGFNDPTSASSDGPQLAQRPNEDVDIYSYDSFSEVKHAAPLSFGISIRKELDPTFSIESGLIYTYLYTKYENTSPYREARMNLHYLGIPLNLVGKIYDADSWKVYASFGGMLEKGLHSIYKQKNTETGGSIAESTISGSIDGVQVSLNLALGIEYKLNKNYSIYFEPKAGYFFDNDQPVSIRTEHPFNVGVAAGIRINLN